MAPALQPPPVAIRLSAALRRELRSFRPAAAIGGALDGQSAGETAQIYTRSNLRLMAAAGLGEVGYRLRTELGVEAWHIDPAGRFSDARGRQGYWTSSSTPTAGLKVSWGYELPRRGDTNDQANDAGFSRLDDGRLNTFWKSNPYLDRHFTHEANQLHPQWVLIDLGRLRLVDGIRIAWDAPYATSFQVQQYVGSGDPTQVPVPGPWSDFPTGRFLGRGGSPTLRLASQPVRVRYLRVLMSASSDTGPRHSRDIRDRLGYAIRELYVGRLDSRGALHDWIHHAASQAQSTIYVSSTDPWHRAADRDPGYEQPSFQTIMRSGLTHRLPVLVPVPVLYGTPQNAVSELRYLRALGVPLRGVELGEEPDGQLISPEDYGALYVQFAQGIHRAFPRLPLGGPGYQTSIPDWVYWPNAHGDISWTRRFVEYLWARGAIRRLGFFSFEWYPFDNTCLAPGPQLATMSQQLTSVWALQRAEGIPSRLPVYVTEYGYSAFAGQDEVDFPGALLDADTVGTLLNLGVSGAYLYGYEPASLMADPTEPCNTWGNLTMIQSNDQHRALHRVATFWETQMVTRLWAQSGVGLHALYAASAEGGGTASGLVHVYAVRRPDRRLALLVLNLSPRQPFEASVDLETSHGPALPGKLLEWQFSSADYRWRDRGPLGLPLPDRPPVRGVVGRAASIRLPPFSITVLRTAAPVPPSG